jgi:nitrate/TMAO reductase-like tetraheme cytochrome c subunit
MNRLALTLVFAAVLGVVHAPPARGQQVASRCADCHYAQTTAIPNPDHLYDWDRSPHARNSVGCEKCHGGNSKVFEPALAHMGILPPGNRKSPVNRANLPATCGGCHVGPFVAFQDSRHYELLKNGDEHGPTCSTCHDAVAGTLLSPKALEAQCNQCHGPKEIAPRAARAKSARELYEGLAAVRKELKLAQQMIKRVDDKQRRADLMDRYEQAQVPVIRAINAGHKFVYDELKQYVGVAQERTEKLMASIANRTQ